MSQWLDGDRHWRAALREIGQIAQRFGSDAQSNLSAAKRAWEFSVQVSRPWIRTYLGAVPLLHNTARRADNDSETFVEFMRDLASLASL